MRKYFSVVGALFCLLQKNLSLIPTGSSQMAHPKSQKIFYPFTYLELRSRNAPCFYKKFEKIFFSIEGLDSACSKSPFTYSHREGANSNPVSKNILLLVKTSSPIPTERIQMHTLNLKKFYPFTYLELGSRNAPCFHKKFEKDFV